jgi:hypothetical protein
MSSRVALLLRQMDAAYQRAGWHGPTLRGSLRGVTAERAARRPAPGRHNVWELAVHAAYWKYDVRRRLIGGKRGSFELAGSNWFTRPEPGRASGKVWKADLALLDREHRALRRIVEDLPDEALDNRPAASRSTRERLIYGIVAHDVYRAGQIQLVKALIRRRGGTARKQP